MFFNNWWGLARVVIVGVAAYVCLIVLRRTMKAERVVEDEIYEAMRSQGVASLEEVEAVVLEIDGTFSVLRHSDQDYSATALKNVSQSRVN